MDCILINEQQRNWKLHLTDSFYFQLLDQWVNDLQWKLFVACKRFHMIIVYIMHFTMISIKVFYSINSSSIQFIGRFNQHISLDGLGSRHWFWGKFCVFFSVLNFIFWSKQVYRTRKTENAYEIQDFLKKKILPRKNSNKSRKSEKLCKKPTKNAEWKK